MRQKTPTLIYEMPAATWVLIGAAVAVAALGFHAGVMRLVSVWFGREEYSHGVLIPLIAAFLIWQRKNELQQAEFKGSWAGVALVLVGGALKVVGDLGTFYILQQYALLIALYGLVLSLTGWQIFRHLWVPLSILVFMIPLPEFVLQNFSARLQLVSSQIGVFFIRLFDISVYVEGNVIDLGGYKLQVAEACDGLRYLFPLMTLGFLMAYFFKVRFWKRAVLFLSSIPVTILMNSFRIGMIGVMVEHRGIAMAEGFLHDFQGWAVFMTSTAVMLVEMMILARIGKESRPWREVFGLEFPGPAPTDAGRAVRPVAAPFVVSTAVLAGFAGAMALVPERVDSVPQRDSFLSFPLQVEQWSGRREILDRVYLDALKLDDYVLANYLRDERDAINFYVAWYGTQRHGQATHSPRSCLPAGGWQITDLRQITLDEVQLGSGALRVNRVLIESNNHKQLVYYWFQQRGRIITNEYAAKWYLFWDSLTRQRTDGALVRLVTPIKTIEDVRKGDTRLAEFAADIAPRLERYIPN